MTTAERKIRELMPRNYGNVLAERTGCHHVYARRVVLEEDESSYIWPTVLEVAEETLAERELQKKKAARLRSAS